MSSLPSACVIGAGSSGIAAVKALAGHGYRRHRLREVRPRRRQLGVGQQERRVLRLPLAAHQHLARAHGVLRLPDAEVVSRLPAPHAHRALLRRLRRPLRHPRPDPLRDRRRARRAAARRRLGASRSTTARRTRYDALLVANGHHWDARWPEPAFPGADDFEGVQIHSHDYKGDDPDFFRDKTVVVLGMGNSAMDIAVEASFVASQTYLAARRGAHVIPKYLFGKPIDQIGGSPKIPFAVRRRVLEGMLKVSLGDMERYGLPKPDHRFGDAHPTISDDILSRMAHGTITAKPNIASLTRDRRALHRRLRGRGRRRRLLHGLQGHVPVLRRGLHRRAGQRPAAVPPHVPPRRPERVLRRAAAAARRDHADRRGAVGVDQRLPRRPLRAALPGRAAGGHGGGAGADVQALRRLQAPHHAGRLRRLDGGDREGAQGGRGARGDAGLPPPRGAASFRPVAA